MVEVVKKTTESIFMPNIIYELNLCSEAFYLYGYLLHIADRNGLIKMKPGKIIENTKMTRYNYMKGYCQLTANFTKLGDKPLLIKGQHEEKLAFFLTDIWSENFDFFKNKRETEI